MDLKFRQECLPKGMDYKYLLGNQPSTAGPVYIGASVFLLFIFGLFF